MRHLAISLSVAALFAVTLLTSAPRASAAHLACKAPTFGFGRGSSMEEAMERAKENWRMSARELYGPRYTHWHNSLDPGRKCDFKQGLVYCKIWATPCR